MSVDRSGRHLCAFICMHPHRGKVMAEARFHKGSRREIERLARRG
jgi:hypothetical protein